MLQGLAAVLKKEHQSVGSLGNKLQIAFFEFAICHFKKPLNGCQQTYVLESGIIFQNHATFSRVGLTQTLGLPRTPVWSIYASIRCVKPCCIIEMSRKIQGYPKILKKERTKYQNEEMIGNIQMNRNRSNLLNRLILGYKVQFMTAQWCFGLNTIALKRQQSRWRNWSS